MAKDLPYLPTHKNVAVLFDKIEKAKVPEVFTTRFLADTIGLKGSADRNLIAIMKKLGFIDNAGKPTPEYNLLKNRATAKAAIAKGIRKAYAPLFEANEAANTLPFDQLKGLVAQVSGAEEKGIGMIAGTFNALSKTPILPPLRRTSRLKRSRTGTVKKCRQRKTDRSKSLRPCRSSIQTSVSISRSTCHRTERKRHTLQYSMR